MLYLGIDQHARQITISLRDESGDVVQARQVSTQPEKVRAFFQQLTRERHDIPLAVTARAELAVDGLREDRERLGVAIAGLTVEGECHSFGRHPSGVP